MSLRKLTPGGRYTYLTRHGAATGDPDRCHIWLDDDYYATGGAPGVWMGAGLASLGVSGTVTEQQMRNLFGQGIHPDAEVLAAESIAAGHGEAVAQAASRLGAKFSMFNIDPAWRDELAAGYRAYNRAHDQQPGQVVPPAAGEQVRTEVANRMFEKQHDRAPASAAELSDFVAQQSRLDRTAVAGFDITFYTVSSVFTLWANGPTEVSEQIEAAHQMVVEKTVAWIEKEAGYARIGAGSARQVQTRGLVMAAFTHRDSAAGNPDLHTHVAISNKVQRSDADGQWQALNGRMLYQRAAGAAEFYNTQLEAEVAQRVGAGIAERAERAQRAGQRTIGKIVGIDRLRQAWSS